jgi:uncharacterized protein (TIGR02466 family)
MKKIPAFNIPFYEFTADEQLTSNMLLLAKNQIYEQNKSNGITIKEPIKNKELINWFNFCLEEVKNDLYSKSTFDIKVSDSWYNKSAYSQKHQLHGHPNSVLSGVFYLTTHEKRARTKFFFPNPFHHIDHIDFATQLKTEMDEHSINGKKYMLAETPSIAGKLIIFPSSLKHYVDTNVSRENRYTISFNSFFSGILGKRDNTTTLNIIVQYPDLE